MSAAVNGAHVYVVHVEPVDVEAGIVRATATLDPKLVKAAVEQGDGGPVSLALAYGLLRGVASKAPALVRDAVESGLAAISEGMAKVEDVVAEYEAEAKP